jgi:hypothetical protein
MVDPPNNQLISNSSTRATAGGSDLLLKKTKPATDPSGPMAGS